jgi:hypothetical protein
MKIVTCITNPDQIGYKHALKASCEYFGLELITLQGRDWKSYRERCHIYKEYLISLDPQEIVFFSDGYDVIFVSGEQEILEKYYRLAPNGQILLSADRFCAPDPEMSQHFTHTQNDYDFLCAGGFMGRAGEIVIAIDKLFEGVKNDNSSQNKEFFWCDQYMWTKLVLSKEMDIILDHDCEIFQTFTSAESIQNLYELVNNEPALSEDEDLYARKSLINTIKAILDEVEITDECRIYNKTTKTYPVQIHYNTKINKLVMFMEPFVKLVEKVN